MRSSSNSLVRESLVLRDQLVQILGPSPQRAPDEGGCMRQFISSKLETARSLGNPAERENSHIDPYAFNFNLHTSEMRL